MTHVVRVCWAQTATTDFPWSYTCSVSSYVQTQEVAWIRHKGVSPQQLCMCLPGPWRHPQPCLSLPIPRGLLPCPQLRTPFELPRAISLCSSNATAGPIYSSPAGLAQPELRETGIYREVLRQWSRVSVFPRKWRGNWEDTRFWAFFCSWQFLECARKELTFRRGFLLQQTQCGHHAKNVMYPTTISEPSSLVPDKATTVVQK